MAFVFMAEYDGARDRAATNRSERTGKCHNGSKAPTGSDTDREWQEECTVKTTVISTFLGK